MTATPEALRDEGTKKAENAADMRVVAIIDALIAEANASGRAWSCNDIRQFLPTTKSQGLVGARVRAAKQRGEMEVVMVGCESCGTLRPETVPSSLDSTHGKPIYVYKGVAA